MAKKKDDWWERKQRSVGKRTTAAEVTIWTVTVVIALLISAVIAVVF